MNRPIQKFSKHISKSKLKKRLSSSEKITFEKIDRFIDFEKETFSLIRPLALLFFTINVGSIAALFRSYPQHEFILCIFSVGIFISLIFLILSISRFIRSITNIHYNKYNEFIELRKKAHTFLQFSIYFCLITLEAAIIVFVGNTIIKH